MEFIPEYMEESYFDEIYTVLDEDAFRLVKEAAEKEGLLIGRLIRRRVVCRIERSRKSESRHKHCDDFSRQQRPLFKQKNLRRRNMI